MKSQWHILLLLNSNRLIPKYKIHTWLKVKGYKTKEIALRVRGDYKNNPDLLIFHMISYGL